MKSGNQPDSLLEDIGIVMWYGKHMDRKDRHWQWIPSSVGNGGQHYKRLLAS
ncbi:hypothetical protein [Alicyclobacillus sp. SO9]|uniref:hypothetical protein n=1 Tax=Alicyclobacillus sp. SO9 TaxID=2665646 RepID=UPI0018E7059C|nr:hypothetical protein [Alicyclobacillus sp. SO9]QQE77314.1 hypothetical protein GI364_15255 [Alicyclobacillus sp. SO9]